MKTVSVYDLILRLRKAGLWNAVAGSCQYWATRADYATIYEWILQHEPAHAYGYRVRACKALSHKILGGGVNTASTPKTSNGPSPKWSGKSTSDTQSDPENDKLHDGYQDYKNNLNFFELIGTEPLGFILFSFAVALVLSLVILIVGLF